MLIKDTGFSTYPYNSNPQIKRTGAEAAAKSGSDTSSSVSDSQDQAVRTDTIELSSRPTQPEDEFLTGLKDSICEELNRDTDATRLQYLKDKVSNGSYCVDSETLAGVLLFNK